MAPRIMVRVPETPSIQKKRYSTPTQKAFTFRPHLVARLQGGPEQMRAGRLSGFSVFTRRVLIGAKTNLPCIFPTPLSTNFTSGDLRRANRAASRHRPAGHTPV